MSIRKRVIGILATVPLALGLLVAPMPASAQFTDDAAPAVPGYRYDEFRTPSGNIHCAAEKYGRWIMRCDVYEHYWGGGDASYMRRRSSPWTSYPSDAIFATDTLWYGQWWYMGPFACKSTRKQLKCWNAAGHGWFLSRENRYLF